MKKLTTDRHITTSAHRGAILIVVLICLLFMTIISATMVKLTLSERRQNRREADRIQAEWLVDAARRRAVVQLTQRADFEGEAWKFDLNGRPASVSTVVRAVPDDVESREIEIVADYPAESAMRVRGARTFIVPMIPSSNEQ